MASKLTPITLSFHLLIVLSIILLQASPLRVNQTHTTQDQLPGTWTNTIDVSIGDLPSQYFMCGFAFKQDHFKMWLWNCNCGIRWWKFKRVWRCNGCDNDINKRASGFKIVFCRYNDWKDQIQKIFETSSPTKKKWRPTIMCPENTFVNGFSGSYGVMQGNPLGFHGLKVKCSTTDLKHFNQPEDDYTQNVTPFHNSHRGNFVSGVKIKYNSTWILLGITFFYEPMVIINKIVIDYKNDSVMENYPVTIDSITVKNNGSKDSIKKVGSNKTYESSSRWVNNNPALHQYNVEKGIIITPPNMVNSSDKISNSIYQIYTQNFGFDRQIKTTISSIEELLVTVPPSTEIIINKVVYQQRGSLFFTGSIFLAKMFDKDPIMSTQISGSWEGVTNRGVVNEIQERKLNQKEKNENREKNDNKNSNEGKEERGIQNYNQDKQIYQNNKTKNKENRQIESKKDNKWAQEKNDRNIRR